MEIVLITGTNRGIGLGLVQRYLELGNEVLATCRSPANAAELNNLACDKLEVLALDVADEASVARVRQQLQDRTIDILINNAGVMGGEHQSLEDMDYRAWLNAFAVNTLAPFRVITALRENLRRSQRPRVVSISSQMGSLHRDSSPGFYAYRSSKAALNKVMQLLALELKEDGIVACPLHPGWVRTDMGGSGADISVDESTRGIVALISSLTMEHSGRFWTWDGREHPW